MDSVEVVVRVFSSVHATAAISINLSHPPPPMPPTLSFSISYFYTTDRLVFTCPVLAPRIAWMASPSSAGVENQKVCGREGGGGAHPTPRVRDSTTTYLEVCMCVVFDAGVCASKRGDQRTADDGCR